VDKSKIESGIKLVLEGMGCDLTDQNFADTPKRYAKAMEEMFGVKKNSFTTFEEKYVDMVLLRGHMLHTLCPHHLFQVELTVDLAYFPGASVLGLSKLVRLLDNINTGPVMQEKFTIAAVEEMDKYLPDNRGVAIKVRGTHGCMQCRGVKTRGDVITYNYSGKFKMEPAYQDRFLQLVQGGK